MSAVIQADQALGAGAGTAGKARNDLWVSREITLTETGVGNTNWQWAMLRRPHGSAATLAGAATQSATFTPDRQGTYRIRVVTDAGLPSEDESIKVFRVRYSNTGVLVNRGYVLPAVDEEDGESNYDIDRGYGSQVNDLEWGEPIDEIVTDVHARLLVVEAGAGAIVETDAASLAALTTAGMDDGTTAAVATFNDVFVLDRASAATVDGINVLSVTGGAGRWLREGTPSLKWRAQAAWFIDAAGGDDEADGSTDATPIKTQAEWLRRTGAEPTVPQTITILTASSEDMVWPLENNYDTALVTVRGPELSTLTPIYTGTVTAAVDWDESVRQSGTISVSGLPVSFTASGLVDKLVVMTSGVASGYCFWIVKDLGTKTARVTIATDLAETLDYAYPAPGDTFEVYSSFVALSGQQFVALHGHSSALQFKDLTIGNAVDGPHQGRSTLGDPFFVRCKVYGWDAKGASAPQFHACSLDGLRIYDDAEALCFASVHFGPLSVHQGNLVPEWLVMQGVADDGKIVLNESRSTLTPVGYVAFFDTALCLDMGAGSTVDLTESGGIDLWGEDVSGTGISTGADARILLHEDFLPAFDAPTFASLGGYVVADASPIEVPNGATIRHMEQTAVVLTGDTVAFDTEYLTVDGIPVPGPTAAHPVLLVCDGDSRVAGTGATAGYAWPALAAAQVADGRCYFVNSGTESETIAQMAADAATDVDAVVDPRGTIVVVLIGVNSFVAGVSAVDAYAQLTAYVQARQAAGSKVIVMTDTPSSLLSGPQTTQQLAYNVLVKANTAGADAVVDLAGFSVFSTTASSGFYDGTHFTTIGNQVAAAAAAAAANALLGYSARTVGDLTSLRQIPGCTGEWRADAAGNTLAGSDVSLLVDLSGQGRSFTGSTGGGVNGNRPAYLADYGDGLPAIHFDSTNNESMDYAGTVIPDGDGQSTLVMWVAVNTAAQGILWSQTDDATYPRGRWIRSDPYDTSVIVAVTAGVGGTLEVFPPTRITNLAWARVAFINDGKRERVLVNDREVSNTIVSAPYGATRTTLGAYNSTSGRLGFGTMWLRHMATYDRALTRSELEAVDRLLPATWGAASLETPPRRLIGTSVEVLGATVTVKSTGGLLLQGSAATVLGVSSILLDTGGTIGGRGAGPFSLLTTGNVSRHVLRWTADVAVLATPSVYTTLLTLAVSGATGGRPVTLRGVMHVWEAGGATMRQAFEVTMRPDGGTGAMVGAETIDVAEGDALGTLEIDTTGGCRFRFLAAASSVNAKTACITNWELS